MNLKKYTDQQLEEELGRRKNQRKNESELQEFLEIVDEEYSMIEKMSEALNDMAYRLENSGALLSERVAQYGSRNCKHEPLYEWESKNKDIARYVEDVSESLYEYCELIDKHVITKIRKDLNKKVI